MAIRNWRLPRDSTDWPVQVVRIGNTFQFKVGATATNAGSTTIASNVLRAVASADMHVLFDPFAGTGSTSAATTDFFLVGGVPEYIGVAPGSKVSARVSPLATAATAELYITEPA